MKCLKVPNKEANKVKNVLIEDKALAYGYKPVKEKSYVYFPLSKKVSLSYDVVEKDCVQLEDKQESLGSFDQVGDIVILGEKVDVSLAKEIVKRKGVKVVLRKKWIHKGEFRTQDMEVLEGEDRKETVYKENGVEMRLDVETCYFSPRLSTERRRVADLVKDGEKILVLFSGVAPYPLVIARNAKPFLIVGVEKNPVAHEYAVKNCEKFSNIELFNQDAKEFSYKSKFDRVFMPLPKSAEDFLDVALSLVKKGGVVHFYDFVEEKGFPENSVEKIKKKIKSFKVLDTVICGQYGPGKVRVCIDFSV